MSTIDERTLALAGIVQANRQVQSLARTGQPMAGEFDSLLKSICVLDAISTEAVYGGLEGVRSGLSDLSRGLLTSTEAGDLEVLKYTMQIQALQNQLYRDQQLFNQFGTSVEQLSAYSGEQFIGECSKVYQNFVSPLKPQIIVHGEEEHLKVDGVPEQIRAMLLAAVRSSVLWQQKGGGRFRLIWERTRMQNSARAMLARIQVH